MRKIFTSILLLAALSGFSQDSTMVEQYCGIIATAPVLSHKLTIEVDFGDPKKGWRNNRLRDEKGKAIKFNSVIDALNYFGKEGWKLVNAITVAKVGSPEYHYIFKREVYLKDVE